MAETTEPKPFETSSQLCELLDTIANKHFPALELSFDVVQGQPRVYQANIIIRDSVTMLRNEIANKKSKEILAILESRIKAYLFRVAELSGLDIKFTER